MFAHIESHILLVVDEIAERIDLCGVDDTLRTVGNFVPYLVYLLLIRWLCTGKSVAERQAKAVKNSLSIIFLLYYVPAIAPTISSKIVLQFFSSSFVSVN